MLHKYQSILREERLIKNSWFFVKTDRIYLNKFVIRLYCEFDYKLPV